MSNPPDSNENKLHPEVDNILLTEVCGYSNKWAENSEPIKQDRADSHNTFRSMIEWMTSKDISFDDMLLTFRFLNLYQPPIYKSCHKEQKTSTPGIRSCNDNIPGAFRPPWVPIGLWKYDGTIYEVETKVESVVFQTEYQYTVTWYSVLIFTVPSLSNKVTKSEEKGFQAGGEIQEIDETEILYEKENPIMHNNFCKISKGIFNSQVVVVKQFNSISSVRDKKKMRLEAKNLLHISHPNIVRFLGITIPSHGIVMEYVEKVIYFEGEEVIVHDVRGLLDNVDDLTEIVRLQIAHDSAIALQFLHRKEIIHVDVKAGNFFLGGGMSDKYIVKLGDFGESVRLLKTKTIATTSLQLTGNAKIDQRKIAGTLPFIAPELYNVGTKPNSKSDVYSFSMYMLELLIPSRIHPWADDSYSPDLIPSLIQRDKRPSLPTVSGNESRQMKLFKDIVTRCWHSNADLRPSMEIVENLLMGERQSQDKKDWLRRWIETFSNLKISCIPLDIHQGSAIDIAGELATSILCAKSGPNDIVSEITHAMTRFDGTNACQYLSGSFAAMLLDKGTSILKCDSSSSKLKVEIESKIISIPQLINANRDINKQVFPEEAMKILCETGAIKCQSFNLTELFVNQENINSENGLHNLENALRKLIDSNTSAAAIYTCPPIALAVYSLRLNDVCFFLLIDSHCVPTNVGGTNSAIIISLTYDEENASEAISAASFWLKERILSSSREGGMQSLLQLEIENEIWEAIDEDILCSAEEITEEDKNRYKDNICNTKQKTPVTKSSNNPKINERDEILWTGYLTKFGYSSFKEFQVKAINAIENDRDVIVIQPTGMGKSLCFQVPSLFDNTKTTIVISPTLSLIRSQLDNLDKLGIDAIPLGRSAGDDKEENLNRILGESVEKPAMAYTTPEYFETIISNIKKASHKVRMIVFDEVHKVFDRQSCFRESYDSLATLKQRLPNIQIMALTATLSEGHLKTLSQDYLHNPYIIKGTVNRKNIKLSVSRYKTEIKKKLNAEGDSILKYVASDVKKIIGQSFAIIYMDFTNEVKDLCSYLSKTENLDAQCYYGKGMNDTTKAKIVDDFNAEKFQVLCATESYEVGVHNPHVEIVARIGCMRNMNVLVQEIGRAGRTEETLGLGIIFFNENKDDQRLGYWLKDCDGLEVGRMKDDYEKCWKWVYSVYTGDCLREGILQHYEEEHGGGLETKAEDCCLCCELKCEINFDIASLIVLIIKAIKELEQALHSNGVSESKLIPWLRGAKQDWLAKVSIQEIIDNSSTYSKGTEIDGKRISAKVWEIILRQSIKLGYIKIVFNTFELKIGGKPIVRIYRSYTSTVLGSSFIEKERQPVYVMSPFIDLLSSSDVKKVATKRRDGRNLHYLPKIKGYMENTKALSNLKTKEEYEFLGYVSTNCLYFCKNYAETTFAAKLRIHFLDDDNQLSKSSSQTQVHDVTVDGTKVKVNIRRSVCEGVKVCSMCPNYVVSNRQRINRCQIHKRSVPLKETGKCPVHFIYVWPVHDDGRRWIGSINDHNHERPAPHKISSQVQEDIQMCALKNPRSTAKDLSKGLGMDYVPGEKSIAAVNIDRIRRERRLAMGSILGQEKENQNYALTSILDFEKIKRKVELNQDEDDQPWTTKVNSLMGNYQMDGNEYLFTPSHKYAFFMAPFQAQQLAHSCYIFVDITYTGNTSFPYLLNVVSLNEKTLLYNAVGRVLCNRQDSVAYSTAFKSLFAHVTKKFPQFDGGVSLEVILVDFDDAEAKGLTEALGTERAEKVLRGCQVHWTRSLQRVAKIVTKNSEEQKIFLILGNLIPKTPEKQSVVKLFKILSGQEPLISAHEFLKGDHPPQLNNDHWKRLKSWSEWWCRERHLKMFTKAHTPLQENTWENAPKTTNPVESINKQSIHEKGCSMYALLENIYMEDRGHAAKIVASDTNVSLSYRYYGDRQKKKENRKRKRSSFGKPDNVDDNAPPDKRRNIERSEGKGKALIGRKLMVEYQEEGADGREMVYLGWFQGQIMAYNKRQGYFVKFDDKVFDNKTILGWSEWIEQLDAEDIKLV